MRLERSTLRPLMVFSRVSDFTADYGEFVIDSVEEDKAVGRWLALHTPDEDHFEVPIESLLNPALWRFEPVTTADTMHEKIRYLQGYVRKLKRPPEEAADEQDRAE